MTPNPDTEVLEASRGHYSNFIAKGWEMFCLINAINQKILFIILKGFTMYILGKWEKKLF